MNDDSLNTFAWLLAVAPIFNFYFVIHGLGLYRGDPGRSPILFVIFLVKFTAWILSAIIGLFALRYLLDIRVFPLDGVDLIFVFIVINLIPLIMHLVLRRYVNGP